MKGDLVEVVVDYRSGVQRCDRELDLLISHGVTGGVVVLDQLE
jgi:hypothetical protein